MIREIQINELKFTASLTSSHISLESKIGNITFIVKFDLIGKNGERITVRDGFKLFHTSLPEDMAAAEYERLKPLLLTYPAETAKGA